MNHNIKEKFKQQTRCGNFDWCVTGTGRWFFKIFITTAHVLVYLYIINNSIVFIGT
jgi:hypothetical protein